MAGPGAELVKAGTSQLMAVGQDGLVNEQFVAFGLADRDMAVDITVVREIIRMPEQITAMPQAPDVVLGMIQLRGTLVPLVCLRRLFALPQSGHAERKVLVTEAASGLIGLVVDEVREVCNFPQACQERTRSLKQHSSDRFVNGLANQHGRVTVLFDLAALDEEFGLQLR